MGNFFLPWKVHPSPRSSSCFCRIFVLTVSPMFPANGLNLAMFPFTREFARSEVVKGSLVLGVDS
jgi:hypothetical protein